MSKPVVAFDAELDELVSGLCYHLDSGPPSVGIAAPQIGVLARVAIVDVGPMFSSGRKRRLKSSNSGRMVLVNPEITSRSGEVVGREGCLSVPDYTGNVPRSVNIAVSALDARGQQQHIECFGFEARAVQHELDHLDGILFLDRVLSPREVFRRKTYR